jgi:hypothetical protein
MWAKIRAQSLSKSKHIKCEPLFTQKMMCNEKVKETKKRDVVTKILVHLKEFRPNGILWLS